MAESGIQVDDHGASIGRTLGQRRLKALLLLAQHPELDDDGWLGKVEFHFGGGHSVKGSVHPAAVELR